MKIRFAIFLMMLFSVGVASAVSISPEVLEILKATGQLEQIIQADKMAREKGVWEPNPEPYRNGITTDIDTLHCLIILVDFEDMPHENGYNASPEDFVNLLFSDGVNDPGSMTDYYFETSYGQAYLMGEVTQWYRMPELYSYYVDGQRGFGSYPRNAQRLTEDAVLAADPDVDFSIYDNDDNGQVDGLFIVHAGPGYEDTGNVNYIHSHAWVTSYHVPVDGVYVYRYSMEPEETGSNQLITIGVFCHEFGHVLGLPDLYDTDYSSDGVGMWSLMASGSWGGGGAIPVHFDAWCKYTLWWLDPFVVEDPLIQEQIDAVEYSPDVYQLYSLGNPFYQYFLVENRRWMAFDVSLPGEGLLIYHIDESRPNNNNEDRYKVAVEQADGQYHLENGSGSDSGDPWPGMSDNRLFDDFSVPDARLYDDQISEISIMNISDSDSMMFADLAVEYFMPLFELLDLSFSEVEGNGNDRPEPGETLDLIFTAQNVRLYVDDISVTGSCSDPEIVFSDTESWIGGQPINDPFDNQDDPMTFSVPVDFAVGFVEFMLTFTAQGGGYQQEISQRVLIGMPDYLLVDDDGGLDEHTYFTSAMENLDLPYDIWDISTQGSAASVLDLYPLVIWFTGDTRPETMSSEDVTGLINYLSGDGGRLLMTSQDFVQRLSERGDPDDLTLLHDYLKVDYDTRDQNHLVTGETGTVFEGMQWLTAGNGGAGNQLNQDALIMQDGGIQMLAYGTGRVAGVAAIGVYASLTLGFGIEGIYNGYPGYDTREDILQAAINFLFQATPVTDQPEPVPHKMTLSQNYPNPFNPNTKIAFELPNSGNVKLAIYDLLGRIVDVPFNGFAEAGRHEITWDGEDSPSGIYFYRLETSEGTFTRRMTLLK